MVRNLSLCPAEIKPTTFQSSEEDPLKGIEKDGKEAIAAPDMATSPSVSPKVTAKIPEIKIMNAESPAVVDNASKNSSEDSSSDKPPTKSFGASAPNIRARLSSEESSINTNVQIIVTANTTSRSNVSGGSSQLGPAPWASETTSLTPESNSATLDLDELSENEYEDAEAVQDSSSKDDGVEVTLDQSFEDCDAAIKLFFDNDIKAAIAVMRPWVKKSLYHSLGMAIFEFIPAILTFDKTQISNATDAVKNCLSICSKKRRRYSFAQNIGAFIKKPNYAGYTDVEAHAELCYAECMLLQAALIFVDGDDYSSYVRTTFKIKNCYNTYQTCWDIKEGKKWDNTESQHHFNSGVRLGTATFSLLISLLPPKVIALLEFVGFSGNKRYALDELSKGGRLPGLRAVLCDLTLLVYHVIICPFTGGEGDMRVASKILDKSLGIYPRSVWFIALRGRFDVLHGRLSEAADIYKQAIVGQEHFKQFRHLCYWEQIWVYGLMLDYVSAAMFAEKLSLESSWSRTTTLYIKAAMLLQVAERDSDPIQLEHIETAMRLAPQNRVRIAGKSLPMEKFILRRCNRYYGQQHRLLLPGLELMCLWNLFPTLTNNKSQLHEILKVIENSYVLVADSPIKWMGAYGNDNKALLSYIHGCVLCSLQLPRQALEQLQNVLDLKKSIKEDTFLVPYALCEMAMCYYYLGNMQKSLELLHDAKKKYSGYELETRLHFRVHARIDKVRSIIGASKFKHGRRGISIDTTIVKEITRHRQEY